uniref:hypothetical protein n=1 Tax=Thiolapillus sp. TaxID=2017437 RepID=UPI003AF7D426
MVIHPQARTTPKLRAEIKAQRDRKQVDLAKQYDVSSTLSYFPTPPPTGFCGSLSSPVSLLNKSGELFGCRFWL